MRRRMNDPGWSTSCWRSAAASSPRDCSRSWRATAGRSACSVSRTWANRPLLRSSVERRVALLREAVACQAGEADPFLRGGQRVGGERVGDALDAPHDERPWMVDKRLAIGSSEQSEGLLAQLARDGWQIGLQRVAHLGEQAAAAQFGGEASGQVPGLPLVGVANEQHQIASERSEERRVGKEGVSTCRSRWSPVNVKKKEITQYTQT